VQGQANGATPGAHFDWCAQAETLDHEGDDVCPAPEFQPPTAVYQSRGAFSEVTVLVRTLWRSAYRLRVAMLVGGIAAVLIANIFGQVRLNEWNGSFFDALQQRNLPELGHQLLIFLIIIAGLLALVVGQTWMQEMLKVRLREWLTHHLLDKWLVAGRAYRLGLAGQIGVNPDQRIEEDTRKLTELSASLGVGVFQATLLLISFISILWVLSSQVSFTVGGHHIAIPGYMVWCALLYA
jgi:putative ATP-binding cassette transporter